MTTTRWTRRSAAAKVLALVTTVAPLVSAAVVCLVLARLWARHQWPGPLPVRVLALAAVGAAVGSATARLARRLLPLAPLLHLTLSFPDRAPSRIGVALRANRARRLQRIVERGEPLPAGTPQDVATMLLALIGWMTIHDRRTRGHAERVCAIAALLAAELSLPDEERDQLAWAALLHDVGKIAVPAAVLNKKGPLDEAERRLVESHTVVGHDLVAGIADWLGPYGLVPLEHHERIDGTGYPHGKAGTEISWGARIVAVADVLDVMTSARSYQPARSWDDARAELVRWRGRQFDPVVVAAALRCSIPVPRIANLAAGATGGGSVAAFVKSAPSKALSLPAGVIALAMAGVVGAAATVTAPVPPRVDAHEREVAAPAPEAPAEAAPTTSIDAPAASPPARPPASTTVRPVSVVPPPPSTASPTTSPSPVSTAPVTSTTTGTTALTSTAVPPSTSVPPSTAVPPSTSAVPGTSTAPSTTAGGGTTVATTAPATTASAPTTTPVPTTVAAPTTVLAPATASTPSSAPATVPPPSSAPATTKAVSTSAPAGNADRSTSTSTATTIAPAPPVSTTAPPSPPAGTTTTTTTSAPDVVITLPPIIDDLTTLTITLPSVVDDLTTLTITLPPDVDDHTTRTITLPPPIDTRHTLPVTLPSVIDTRTTTSEATEAPLPVVTTAIDAVLDAVEAVEQTASTILADVRETATTVLAAEGGNAGGGPSTVTTAATDRCAADGDDDGDDDGDGEGREARVSNGHDVAAAAACRHGSDVALRTLEQLLEVWR